MFRKRHSTSDRKSDQDVEAVTSPAVAALIASVEMTATEMRQELSQYELRKVFRDQDNRENDQVWQPIRRAALAREDRLR